MIVVSVLVESLLQSAAVEKVVQKCRRKRYELLRPENRHRVETMDRVAGGARSARSTQQSRQLSKVNEEEENRDPEVLKR